MVIKYGAAPKRFQSTWDTTQAGSANDTVVLPLNSAGSYDFRIDWGDGKTNRDNITAYNQAEVTHTYDNTGIYEIRIIGGITGWYFNNGGDDDKILTISSWGPLLPLFSSNSLYRAFYGCFRLQVEASDPLNLDGISNIQGMFRDCYNFGSNGYLNNWDVSNITNMSALFYIATKTMNLPLDNWDVSNVTDMNQMFYTRNNGNNAIFDQDLSSWDVSNVESMAGMFQAYLTTHSFNNGGSPEISGWNTGKVQSMNFMFASNTGFNQPIGSWDTSSVTNMAFMFSDASRFNQDISNWETSGVQDMTYMFWSSSFNNGGSTGINNWNTSSNTSLYRTFGRTSFNQPIGNWDTSNVTNMGDVFYENESFNQPLSGWNTSNVTNMAFMFTGRQSNSLFNQDIGSWDVSNVTDMTYMFRQYLAYHNFNNGGSPSISGWNTSKVTSMRAMFEQCSGFNQPIGYWNTNALTDIQTMFYNADAFDQDLSNWTVTGITNATNFMQNANGLSTTNYDSTLSGWSSQAVQSGVSIHFGGSKYSTATGLAYRNALVASGWTITDGGAV